MVERGALMFVIIDMGQCCHYCLQGGLFTTRKRAETYRDGLIELESIKMRWKYQTVEERCAQLAIVELTVDPGIPPDNHKSQVWP